MSDQILYDSSRGKDMGRTLGEAIEQGLATDGGLYLPRSIPAIDPQWIDTRSFLELSISVLDRWMVPGEFADVFRDILSDALSFPVPVVPVDQDLFVCELFHGPTLSFKDFGARTMARLLGNRLQRTGERRVILVATSGDTGSAVADGFAGIDGIDVVLLYPEGGVSEVQERQLIVRRPNVHPFRVRGSFDDCQKMVKEAFQHEAWKRLPLSTANSINIGRLLPQMLYYWWAVLNLTEGLGTRTPHVCVPSGNLGNLTAGVMAHLSGMPVSGFIAAHNANDFFPRFLDDASSGFSATVRTVSNAMDVGAPSNFERLVALLPGRAMGEKVRGGSISDAETIRSMREVHDRTGYLADPHTAVGLSIVERLRTAGKLDGPVIVMSTAHPAKFPDTCAEAVGVPPEEPTRLAMLRDLPSDSMAVEADTASLGRLVSDRLL